MPRSKTLATALFAMFALVGCTAAPTPEPAAAPPTELKMQNVLEQALNEEFVAGREVVVSYIEIPPNTELERHRHPGEEFIYVLEGSGKLLIDGEPEAVAGPGSVWHVPYQAMHTGASLDEGLRAVVFRVHTSGEPVRYLEDGGTSEH